MAVLLTVKGYDTALEAREGFGYGHSFLVWNMRLGRDEIKKIHDFDLDEIIEIYWRSEDHPRHHMDVTVCHPRDFE
jgi:hypothetical protein